MCRSYHTGRDHPACDAVLRHDPVASLDGTLHRHLHAPELSPTYLCFSADQNGRGLAPAPSLSLNSSHPRLAGVPLSPCRFFVTSYRAEPTRASSRESSLHSPLHHDFSIFSRERRVRIRSHAHKWKNAKPTAVIESLLMKPFRTARRPQSLSPHQSRPGPNQRALAICRLGRQTTFRQELNSETYRRALHNEPAFLASREKCARSSAIPRSESHHGYQRSTPEADEGLQGGIKQRNGQEGVTQQTLLEKATARAPGGK